MGMVDGSAALVKRIAGEAVPGLISRMVEDASAKDVVKCPFCREGLECRACGEIVALTHTLSLRDRAYVVEVLTKVAALTREIKAEHDTTSPFEISVIGTSALANRHDLAAGECAACGQPLPSVPEPSLEEIG